MIGQLAATLVSDWSRKFGYSWWGEDAADSAAVAGDFFRRIDENGDGAVAFEEWLTFALGHYRDKSSELPRAFDSLDRWKLVLDIYIYRLYFRAEFVAACAAGGKDVYWFMWKCFQAADVDRDGLVSAEEFDKMITMATANIKRCLDI